MKPYDLPSPTVVADLCAQAAWLDEVDDDVRLRLEFAADTIRNLMRRCIALASKAELVEAERDLLRSVCYGSQKGGAA
jgi:hypothetical protein